MVNEKETVKEEQTTKDIGTGDKPKATTLIDDANTAAERLEKANERMAELIRQQQDLQATITLSGRAEMTEPEKPKEEDPVEYVKRALKGELLKK